MTQPQTASNTLPNGVSIIEPAVVIALWIYCKDPLGLESISN